MRKVVLTVPDGISDQYETIQRALDGGDVLLIIPAGIYPVSRNLKVYSDTKIVADEHAVIYRIGGTAIDIDDCLLSNAHEFTDGEGDENIEIEGGVWNLNNAENKRGENPEDGKSFGGLLFRFTRVKYLTIRDMTLSNAETYFIRMVRVSDFRVLNVNFYNSYPHINQDGVHLNGYCFNGVIKHLRSLSPYTPGDDMVALNADDGNFTNHNHRIELGPIENIDIEDVTGDCVYNFVRILSITQPIRHVRIKGLAGGAMNNFVNMDSWRFPKGKGIIEDVEFSGIKAFKVPSKQDSPAINARPLFMIQSQVKDFVIRDLERLPIDALCTAPTLIIDNQTDNTIDMTTDAYGNSGLETRPDGAVVLDKGGFKCLKIN
jgi:hypothetical protein